MSALDQRDEPVVGEGGPVLLKVLAFSFALALLFTLVANTLPQVEGEAPVETEVALGALTMESFIALGETTFSGKGTCALCHNELGRAPNLLSMDVVAVTRSRLEDPAYRGPARDVEEYLRESLVEPDAYVVKGFGKKGTNDTESPMPAVDRPPIQLSGAEIDAGIAFLQAKDGHPVTVALPSESPPSPPIAVAEAATGADAAPALTVEAAAAKYGCAACHTMLGTESPVGPPLTGVGARLSAAQIRESILDPDAVVTEGFAAGMMPGDFADKMTVRELELLVGYLAEQRQ